MLPPASSTVYSLQSTVHTVKSYQSVQSSVQWVGVPGQRREQRVRPQRSISLGIFMTVPCSCRPTVRLRMTRHDIIRFIYFNKNYLRIVLQNLVDTGTQRFLDRELWAPQDIVHIGRYCSLDIRTISTSASTFSTFASFASFATFSAFSAFATFSFSLSSAYSIIFQI